MEVLVYNKGKLAKKFWGDIVCSFDLKTHEFTVESQSGKKLYGAQVKMANESSVDGAISVYEE